MTSAPSALIEQLKELLQSNSRLSVHVKANAKKTEILAVHAPVATLKIAVHAPPEDGKANTALELFLSKLTKKTAVVVAGKTSKRKVVAFS